MTTALEFEGANCFRQRLILATLTGKKIVINRFRDKVGTKLGIQDYEINLLKLLEKVSNGSSAVIDQKGTKILYKPGTLSGGEIKHHCSLSRSIGYYLEVLLALAPFCKNPIEANLMGVTNDAIDPSVDALKHSALPVMKHFLGAMEDDALDIKILARGLKPEGGGHVVFKCPIRRVLRPVQIMTPGKVKRIRGVAYATRVPPQIANRLVETAKGILLNYIPDIYIYTDHLKGKASGKSPGFGISLVAETNEGVFYVGEAISNPAKSEEGVSIPEDVGRRAAHELLNDIYRGGCVSTIHQSLMTLFMAFGDRDLSKTLLGPLSPYSIQFLRNIREFTALTFKLEPYQGDNADDDDDDEDDEDEQLNLGSKKIVAACIGVGFTNINKSIR